MTTGQDEKADRQLGTEGQQRYTPRLPEQSRKASWRRHLSNPGERQRAAHSPREGEAVQGPSQEREETEKGGVQAELDTTGHSETRGRRARLQGSYGCVEEKGARRERTRSGGHCLA